VSDRCRLSNRCQIGVECQVGVGCEIDVGCQTGVKLDVQLSRRSVNKAASIYPWECRLVGGRVL